MSVHVNIDNFREAETARMLDDFLALTGGVNRWFHYRAPTPVDSQPVIRMNRDTLYSTTLVDISEGAMLTIPDPGDRYLSVMAVNEQHYINAVYSEPGTHELTVADHGTAFLSLSARTFVDPDDPDDVAAVNRLQDQLAVDATSARPYVHPDFDAVALDATRDALLRLSEGIGDTERTFGAEADVEPTRHLIGTATGWGGLPRNEAVYFVETDPKPAGHYTMALTDVPVDAFWSVTIYNRDGYLEANPYGSHSLNSVTSEAESGTCTLYLAPEPDGSPNHLYVMDGWNYTVRLYRPYPEVVDGTWVPPTPQPAG